MRKSCKPSQIRNNRTKRCISRKSKTGSRLSKARYYRRHFNRKPRASPMRSAALERVGARGKGGNSKMWVVKKRSNNIKFWAPA